MKCAWILGACVACIVLAGCASPEATALKRQGSNRAAPPPGPDDPRVEWTQISTSGSVQLISGAAGYSVRLDGHIVVPESLEYIGRAGPYVTDRVLVNAAGQPIGQAPGHRPDIRQAIGEERIGQPLSRSYQPRDLNAGPSAPFNIALDGFPQRPARLQRLAGYMTLLISGSRVTRRVAADGSDGVVELGNGLAVWVKSQPTADNKPPHYFYLHYTIPSKYAQYRPETLPPNITTIRAYDAQGTLVPIQTTRTSGNISRSSDQLSDPTAVLTIQYGPTVGERPVIKHFEIEGVVDSREIRVPMELHDVPLP